MRVRCVFVMVRLGGDEEGEGSTHPTLSLYARLSLFPFSPLSLFSFFLSLNSSSVTAPSGLRFNQTDTVYAVWSPFDVPPSSAFIELYRRICHLI